MNNKKSLNHWLKELKTSKGHYSYSKWLETKSFSSGSKWYFIPEVGACNKCIENANKAYDEDPSEKRQDITHYNCKCDIIYTDDPQSAKNMQSLRDYLLKEKDIETNKDFLTNPEGELEKVGFRKLEVGEVSKEGDIVLERVNFSRKYEYYVLKEANDILVQKDNLDLQSLGRKEQIYRPPSN